MTALVQAAEVSFGFQQGKPILREVTFAVRRGERVAFMGQSGAGKTTLLKLIAGLAGYAPESGTCICGGRLALVFQQPLLFDHLNVRDNITLPSVIRRHASNCDETAKMLGIDHLLRRYPFQLSGGQQRRVALARALACPDVAGLLLDEPFTGLDEPLRERIIRNLLTVLDQTGLACILSTHSPLEACLLADRVIFLGGSPATITGEHAIALPRHDRMTWLERPEFFQEMATLRRRWGTATAALADDEESSAHAATPA